MGEKTKKRIFIRNIRRLYSCDEKGELRIVDDAQVLIEGGKILFAGDRAGYERSGFYSLGVESEVIDAKGMIAAPAFVEAHTHLVFAGDRSGEFERRCAGETYGAIASQGGGILKTVEAVRNSSEEALFIEAEKRLAGFIVNGCATVEIKSGYGLDTENEVKMLRVIKRLKKSSGIEIIPTFLAHTIPREYMEKRGEYVEIITGETLPEISRLRLAEFCDIFLDGTAFSSKEAVTILSRARDLGFKLKIHANQFENNRGGLLAAELGCASAGHLNHTTDGEIVALADKGVSAVLFPGCFISKGDSGQPPVRKLREAGVNLALSTDYNPGSSTTRNIALMGTLAMSLWGMTYYEVFHALTAGAARALLRSDVTGRLEAGFRADIAFFDCGGIEDIFYDYGTNFCRMLAAGGHIFKFFDQRTRRI